MSGYECNAKCGRGLNGFLPKVLGLAVVLGVAVPARGQNAITVSDSLRLGDRIATANLLGYFEVEGDTDPYDRDPHFIYYLCFQEKNAFDTQQACDFVSFNEGHGFSSRGIVPFQEALDPLRGQEVVFWIYGCQENQQGCEASPGYNMKVPLSNIALRPPGYEDQTPYKDVFPGEDDVFASLDDVRFQWPLSTSFAPGPWSGFNDGATKHILKMWLQQSSPQIGGARLSDPVTYEIPISGLSGTPITVDGGQARVLNIDGWIHIEYIPDPASFSHLLDQVNADRVFWQVATCSTIGNEEVCSRTENIAHHGRGRIGIPDQGGPGAPVPGGGLAFADSPLLEVFSHDACLTCHTLVRDAAQGVDGLPTSHLNFNGGALANLSDAERCGNCHSSNTIPAEDYVVPQILDTDFAARHGLSDLSDAEWWAWFAPQYEDGLTWPDHLEDPTSADYDPATACSLMLHETGGADAMRHHLYEDPRVIWSIVGGALPNNGFVDELAPPGRDHDLTTTAGIEAALTEWEGMVEAWINDGMNCGSTSTTNSTGFAAPPLDPSTTPPVTTADFGGGAFLVGAPVDSDATIPVHLDCVDSQGERCRSTYFACGPDADAVQAALDTCDDDRLFAMPSLGAAQVAALCNNASSSPCYHIDRTLGTNVADIPPVFIPSEIGDSTTLMFRSIDDNGNQEFIRTESYGFVEEDTTPPKSSASVVLNEETGNYEVRFTCSDNAGDCVPPEQGWPDVIIYRTLDDVDAGQDRIPRLNNPQFFGLQRSVQVLDPTRVQRLRWLAVDAISPLDLNAEFDGDCPAAYSPVTDTAILTRTGEVECYHELILDPAVYTNTEPPTTAVVPSALPTDEGTYDQAFAVSLLCEDALNDCTVYYTLDGSDPAADVRMAYTSTLIIPEAPDGARTATTTLKYIAVDNAVQPNASAIETVVYTVARPHTDDDLDGYTEDDGDCNDDDPAISPDALEVCDGIDNDCNGVADDARGCGRDEADDPDAGDETDPESGGEPEPDDSDANDGDDEPNAGQPDPAGPIDDDGPITDGPPQDGDGDNGTVDPGDDAPDRGDETPAIVEPDDTSPAENGAPDEADTPPARQDAPVACGAVSPGALATMLLLLGACRARRRM